MIKLSSCDVKFMLDVLDLSSELIKSLSGICDKGGDVSEDCADQLRDLCTDRLDTHGFDENYEPTDEGRKLEGLIDKLFIG